MYSFCVHEALFTCNFLFACWIQVLRFMCWVWVYSCPRAMWRLMLHGQAWLPTRTPLWHCLIHSFGAIVALRYSSWRYAKLDAVIFACISPSFVLFAIKFSGTAVLYRHSICRRIRVVSDEPDRANRAAMCLRGQSGNRNKGKTAIAHRSRILSLKGSVYNIQLIPHPHPQIVGSSAVFVSPLPDTVGPLANASWTTAASMALRISDCSLLRNAASGNLYLFSWNIQICKLHPYTTAG